MTALQIGEDDVARLLTMADAIETLAACMTEWPRLARENIPRGRASLPSGNYNLMGAGCSVRDVFGLKAYVASPAGTRFHVLLFSAANGDLLAHISANLMGQIRTGAITGLATRHMARDDAAVLAVIGTGRQAFAQVAAVAAVRPLRAIRVFSRTPAARTTFARRVAIELGIDTHAVGSAEDCVRPADIIVTITKSAEPVLQGAWLKPGAHVNAAGANAANRRELDAAVVDRAAILAVDCVRQGRLEAAEYIDAVAASRRYWSDVRDLGDIMAGKVAGRAQADDITVFKSLGIALADVAVAEFVYRRAMAEGVGRPLVTG